MENVTSVGIDLSKNIFQLHGVNHAGKMVFKRRVRREKLLEQVRTLERGTKIFIEAGRSSHYWSREFTRLGMEVKQISSRFVVPYVKSSKNDANDAEGIVEAGLRPSMRFVSTKNEWQLALQALHRARQLAVRQRTSVLNSIRSVLAESGIELCKQPRYVRQYLVNELAHDQRICELTRYTVECSRELLNCQEQIIKKLEVQIAFRAHQSPAVKRLLTIPGIGILTASALACVCGNLSEFKNGRQFAAWLGLVPRQYSSGGAPRLLGLSKRGDVYLRTLLIHGARTVVRHAAKRNDPHSLWIQKYHAKKGTNLTAVRLANKNARIAWRLLTTPSTLFDSALPH